MGTYFTYETSDNSIIEGTYWLNLSLLCIRSTKLSEWIDAGKACPSN